MIELPIIELDMTKKDKVYQLSQATFSGEDNVYTIRLKPVNGDLDYDWTDKVAIIVFSAVPDLPKPLDVTDGVVSMVVNSAWVTAGLNRIQLNIYGTDGSIFNEHAPIVEWYVRQSLPVTDPPPERVDLIAHLLGQVTTTVDSLAAVETTCTGAAAAAAQSAKDADASADEALLSEQHAAISETNASGFATTASQRAEAAGGSATAALASQNAAAAAATAASNTLADVQTLATNLVTNGDFSNGTTGWEATGGSITASDGVLRGTASGVASNSSAYCWLSPEILTSSNHIIYARASARVTNNECTRLQFTVASNQGTKGFHTAIDTPTENVWYHASGTVSDFSSFTGTNLRVYIAQRYIDSTAATNKSMEVDNVLCIDLTAAFGAGNEPTAAQMDTILAQFPNSWFDGTENLFNATQVLNRLNPLELDVQTLATAASSISGTMTKAAAEIDNISDAVFTKIENRIVEGTINYTRFDSSTFSGWVSQFTASEAIDIIGFRVYMKARDVAITEACGYFGIGQKVDGETISKTIQSCNIPAGETGFVDFLCTYSLKAGDIFCVGAAANQLTSFGVCGTGSDTESWYCTNGAYPVAVKDFSAGATNKVAAALLTLSSKVALVESRMDELGYGNTAKLHLPVNYQLTIGDTFELFWKGIVEAVDPYIFNIRVACSVGACWKRKFSYTPLDAGIYPLTITIEDNSGKVLDTATTNLVVSAATGSPASAKNVLCVGDSLLSNGQWAYESYRRFTATDGSPSGLGLSNINYVGTCKVHDIGYEGYGGWTFTSYNTANKLSSFAWVSCSHSKTSADQHSIYIDANNARWKIETVEANRLKMVRTSGSTPMPSSGILTWVSGGTETSNITFTASELASGNPFWNETADAVDFTNYATKLGISSIDFCYVMLGWNSTTVNEVPYKAQVKLFLNNILAAFPSCKIALMGLQVPSLDGCGNNYGCSWNWYEKVQKAFLIGDWLAEVAAEYPSVHYINISGQFDSENNMQTSTRPVNVRNSATETYQNNGVHPASSGYYQIADAVFRDLNHLLQQ